MGKDRKLSEHKWYEEQLHDLVAIRFVGQGYGTYKSARDYHNGE
jgi:hypothetical protein